MLKEGRFRRMTLGQVDSAHGKATAAPVGGKMGKRLAALWPKHRRALMQSLEARMTERVAGLEKALSERARKEAEDAASILNELRETIRAELRTPEGGYQLELFTNEERRQFELNRSSLERRVAQIPEEIEREQRAVEARFADPRPQLFPVAVTYLVPRGLARRG